MGFQVSKGGTGFGFGLLRGLTRGLTRLRQSVLGSHGIGR